MTEAWNHLDITDAQAIALLACIGAGLATCPPQHFSDLRDLFTQVAKFVADIPAERRYEIVMRTGR